MSAGIISITDRWFRRPRRKGRQAQTAVDAQGKSYPFVRRWLTALLLMVAAGLIVLYVANSIAITNLMVGITSLERERDMVRNDNERLRADLVRLMSVERVASLATQRLGMVQPTQPPVALPDPEHLLPRRQQVRAPVRVTLRKLSANRSG